MAVTRRQFVAGMSALAASLGFNSAQIAKITEALASSKVLGGAKPKVLWVHGAECTGCSVSLLSLFEDARGTAIEGTTVKTIDALKLISGDPVPRVLHDAGFNVDTYDVAVNVQDILVDWIDLQYHETIMTMGGDLAYQVLKDNMDYTGGSDPFVLVVEGATQDKDLGGAWDDPGHHPWCAIAMNDAGTEELSFDDVVEKLANRADCLGVISIGQCAAFGGFPTAVPPIWMGKGDNMGRQTGSFSTYDFLLHKDSSAVSAANKVVNVPGCPPNPWWFVLTVVCWLVDFNNVFGKPDGENGPLGILGMRGGKLTIIGGVDSSRRLNAVYGTPLHGPACPRYKDYVAGIFADHPGEAGCLQLIGCKAPAVNSLCGLHGWNGQQPQNRGKDGVDIDPYGVADITPIRGGNCIMAGHPCMACTEDGYPDSFVPFVLR